MRNIKKYFTISNVITAVILGLFLYNRVPVFLENNSLEGKPLLPQEYSVFNSPESELFPALDQRYVVIFWATWCGPCKVEMNRLQTSVNEGKIPGDKIVAINSFEEPRVVKKFIQENSYPFTFLNAPELGDQLKIKVTPTTLFLDKGVITQVSSGMSLVGIWRAEKFLRDAL